MKRLHQNSYIILYYTLRPQVTPTSNEKLMIFTCREKKKIEVNLKVPFLWTTITIYRAIYSMVKSKGVNIIINLQRATQQFNQHFVRHFCASCLQGIQSSES